MPVQEYRMRAGSWTVDLVDSAPSRLLDQIAVERWGLSQLVVLPTWLDPRLVSDADMLAAARYTGVYRRQEARTRLSGAHVHTLLGDEDGKADVFEVPRSTAHGWLSEWFAELAFTGFVNGTCTDPGGAYTDPFQWVTRRQAWQTLCDHFGVEWRVTPNLRFDVGPADALYGATPRLVVLRNAGWGGRDLHLSGIQGSARLTADVEDFASKVVVRSGDRDAPTITTATGTNLGWDPRGYQLDIDETVEDYDTTVPASVASARLAEVNHPRYHLEVGADVWDPGALLPVGAPVYVWDPTGGAHDAGNPVVYRGQTIFPLTTRVEGIGWPVRAGMGVYLRRHDGATAEWVDLTPFVKFETGAASVEVGAIPRPAR